MEMYLILNMFLYMEIYESNKPKAAYCSICAMDKYFQIAVNSSCLNIFSGFGAKSDQ